MGFSPCSRALRKVDMQVDILINNAGFGYQGSFEAAEPSLYEDMMYLNMMALTKH